MRRHELIATLSAVLGFSAFFLIGKQSIPIFLLCYGVAYVLLVLGFYLFDKRKAKKKEQASDTNKQEPEK